MRLLNNKKLPKSLLLISAVLFSFIIVVHSSQASALVCHLDFLANKNLCVTDANATQADPTCVGRSEGQECASGGGFDPTGVNGAYSSGGITGVATTAVKNYFDLGAIISNFLTGYLLTWVGWFLSWAAFLLDTLVHALDVFPPVVQTAWTVLRNFANLFFILILLVIAFATIFDNQKYNYRLLPKFIIAALLINFSYLIGTVVKDLANTLGSAFLGQIIASNASLSTAFMEGTKLSTYVGISGGTITNSAITAWSAGSALTVTAIFTIAFIIILALVFLTAAIFLIVRMVALWFLLIFSPLAWLASILPSTQSFTKTWWKEFISWSFFPVIYFFFLALGMGFIRARGQITKFPGANSGSTSDVLSAVFGINDIIFYLLTLGFVGGGLFFAKKAGSMLGGGAVKYASQIQGGVQKYSYKWSGARTRVEGAKEGLSAARDRVIEKGLGSRGFLGAQNARETQAKYAQKFGFGTVVGAVDKARMDNVKKEEDILKKMLSTVTTEEGEAYLREKWAKGTAAEKLASGRTLHKDKKLTPEEQQTLYKLLGGDTSEAARQFSKKDIDYKTWDSVSREKFFNEANDAEVKRHVRIAQAEVGDLREQMADALKNMSTLFQAQKDQLEFLDKVAIRKNAEEAFKAKFAMGLIKDEFNKIITDIDKARESDTIRMSKQKDANDFKKLAKLLQKESDKDKPESEAKPKEEPKPSAGGETKTS